MLTTQQGPSFSCSSFINGACEVGYRDLDNSCPDTLNIVKSSLKSVCLMEGAYAAPEWLFSEEAVCLWHCCTVDIFSCPVSQIMSLQPDPAVSKVWTQSKKLAESILDKLFSH